MNKRKLILTCLVFSIAFASKIALAGSVDLAFISSIKTCTSYSGTYKDPFTGTMTPRKIYGIQNNSCLYKEGSASGGMVMECHFPVSMLSAVSSYYNAVSKSNSTSTDVTINGSSSSTKYTIDGRSVENPLQYAIDKGYCQFK